MLSSNRQKFGVNIAVVLGILLLPVTQANALKLSGFVEPAIKFSERLDSSSIFELKDAALYGSHEEGNASFFFDIPFSTAGSTSNANFNIGTSKGQAFVNWEFSPGMSFKLGQFDTIFGFEQNDGADIRFTQQGRVYADTLPVVHSGLVFDFNSTMWNFKLLFAAPNNAGVVNSTTSPNNNLDYGLKLGWASDMYRASIGGRYTKTSGLNDWLVSTLIGATINLWDIDLELDFKRGAAATETGMGAMLQVLHHCNEKWEAGIRGEYLSKLTNNSEFQITAGPQFKISDSFKIKTDYTFNSSKATSGSTAKSKHTGIIAAVFKN